MTLRAAPALVFAGLLLFCSVADAAPGAPTSCDLLTQGAASALFGAPLDPARPMYPSCGYFGAGGDDKKGVVLMLVDLSGAPMAGMYAQLVHSDPTNRIEPVSGLGDQASFVTRTEDDATTVALVVLDHNRIYQLSATNSPNPHLKSDILQATRRILQRR
jgi:hypothetical protein